MINNVISFITENWVAIGTGFLLFHKLLVSARDAIDKTPEEDNSIFEKFVTISSKVAAYFVKGKRPLTPKEEVVVAQKEVVSAKGWVVEAKEKVTKAEEKIG